MVEPVEITINGNKRMFHFNNYALVELGKITGVDAIEAGAKVMEYAEDDAIVGLTMILTAGFVGWEKSQANFAHGITLKSVSQDMAVCDNNEFNAAYESFKQATGIAAFMESLPKGEAKPEEVKKKSHSRKSLSMQ